MKNRLIIALLVVSTFFISCKGTLDQGDTGHLTYEQIFSRNSLASDYLSTCRSYMPALGNSSTLSNFIGAYTDEAQDANDVIPDHNSLKYYKGESSVSSPFFMDDRYDNLFEGILRCNIFLTYIPNLVHYPFEEYRNRWPAEAHILRALYYWQLIKRYGPMPYLDETNYENYDYSAMERPSFYSNVKSIIADCRKAIEIGGDDLPWRSKVASESSWMTKSIAYAIMSESILYAASPLWCDGEDHWAEASAITKEALLALTDNGFKLFDKTADSSANWISPYQEYFMKSPEYAANVQYDFESIYARNTNMTLWDTYGVPDTSIVPGVTMCSLSPSQELVDAYCTADGVPILDLKQPYLDADHLKPNYNAANTMYDPENPYENRDPRLHSTVICNGDNYLLKSASGAVYTYAGGNCERSITSERYTRTGYYLRKFVNCNSSAASGNIDSYWRHFRLAELYLNYAEAEFYANGVTQNAVDAINMTRRRAFDTATYPGALLTTSVGASDFEQLLRQERRVELAFEEHRYFDLRRWKIQADNEGVVTGVDITKDEISGKYRYDRVVVQRRDVTDSKYLIWAIPLDEQIRFNEMGVALQNPGW